MLHARLVPQQWKKTRDGVLEALRLTLPELREVYAKRAQMSLLRASISSKVNKGRKMVSKEIARPAAVLSEQSAAPLVLQPTKATLFRPHNIDKAPRQQVQDARYKAKREGIIQTRLTD
jgi:hypothetical protein